MPLNLTNANSLFPYLRYSPQANTWFVAGDNGPRPIEIVGKQLLVDIEHGQKGWLTIDVGLREWVPAPTTGPMPKVATPNAKIGFSVLVFAPKVLGEDRPFEICNNTTAHKRFCQRLYNECEPHFGEGKVPVMTLTGSTPVRIGMGMSQELQFKILKWVPRPQVFVDALLLRNGPNEKPDDHGPEDDGTGSASPADNSYARAKSREERRLEQVVTSGKKSAGADIDDDDIPF